MPPRATSVRTNSCSISDRSRPAALKTPGASGTSTRRICSARANGNGDAPYDPLAGLAEGQGEQKRRAYFGLAHGTLDVPVISRAALLDSPPREGPLIVEEYDATCVVPPGCAVTLDSLGNIDIALEP